ncbi:hypothetical protein SDC9_165218 [bioreactor metagenome]|uniref:Uncharacterized protein n=1 Tax=bioreactor metagenome TaxID=1076179 RepID=A0A645G102_9ZZZZ
MVFRNPVDDVCPAGIRSSRKNQTVIRNIHKLKARGNRPCHGCIGVVNIAARPVCRAQSACRISRNLHGECLIFPDGVELIRRACNAGSEQHAVTGLIPRARAIGFRVPACEKLAFIDKSIALHCMVRVVQRAACEAAHSAAGHSAVAIVGDRDVYGGICPNGGQRRVLRDRYRTVRIIDFKIDTGTPADKHLVRRRSNSNGIKRLHLRLTAACICF